MTRQVNNLARSLGVPHGERIVSSLPRLFKSVQRHDERKVAHNDMHSPSANLIIGNVLNKRRQRDHTNPPQDNAERVNSRAVMALINTLTATDVSFSTKGRFLPLILSQRGAFPLMLRATLPVAA